MSDIVTDDFQDLVDSYNSGELSKEDYDREFYKRWDYLKLKNQEKELPKYNKDFDYSVGYYTS